MDSLDQTVSNLEALRPCHNLKKTIEEVKSFCLCGFYWYISYQKLRLRNFLNILLNLLKATMMNPLCVNINNTFSWKIIIFSRENLEKRKECHGFILLPTSLIYDLIEDSWILIWAYAMDLLWHIAFIKVYLVPAQLLQLCPIPCNLMDCSLPDSSVHEILQVRILEWVTMPS